MYKLVQIAQKQQVENYRRVKEGYRTVNRVFREVPLKKRIYKPD